MNIKNIIGSALLLMSLAACGPTTQVLYLDTRHPSDSGMDLDGRSISMVYLDNGIAQDSLYMATVAENLSTKLEEYYFDSKKKIDLYSMPMSEGANYESRDTLVNLVLDTGSDVVFLLKPELPSKFALYAYDSMDSKDQVVVFQATQIENYDAAQVGKVSSLKFKPNWLTEEFQIFVYDDDSWYQVYLHMNQCEWEQAVQILLDMYQSNDEVKRACVAYDLAFCCYMLDKKQLALQWLDAMEAEPVTLPQPCDLRARINTGW